MIPLPKKRGKIVQISATPPTETCGYIIVALTECGEIWEWYDRRWEKVPALPTQEGDK
jgi:hypothetical protein